jgi:DMSO/TMAO reductase YedYZ molybdopterin-dependent catalytic subunit
LTSTNHFFVCNSGTTPKIDTKDFSLRLWGDGISRELILSYDNLQALPQRTVPAVLECAGNNRAFFRDVQGEVLIVPSGTSELVWSTGAVGMAEWSGVSLKDVLELAGVKPEAVQVCPQGSETDSCEGLIRMPMPINKAMDPNTLLALQMNGEALPADHGFPLRVLVPGWIGAYSVKWVRDIEVSSSPIWVRRNTESYVLKGDLWPPGLYLPSKGEPITTLNIKSTLALPWPADVSPGCKLIHGYARSPGSRIRSVEWSEDSGCLWKEATLTGPNEPYGWVRFEFDWQAVQGDRTLMTRATDEGGECQPMSIPFNEGGYLYNAIHPHPVKVV